MTEAFQLPTFNGWTIDPRLKQLRKVSHGENPTIEFIEFDSDEGQEILEEMQEYFGFLYE
jgi:hypothetical protein